MAAPQRKPGGKRSGGVAGAGTVTGSSKRETGPGAAREGAAHEVSAQRGADHRVRDSSGPGVNVRGELESDRVVDVPVRVMPVPSRRVGAKSGAS
ncbi:hypothetical protein GCM10009639_12140 [Kitasatospora putterlickiae]|uniref:Uncharacterized protein n=1 Tax=Kitasatospora putterlickiae TaxID=221725 RepID=A0ABN1XSP6_9ACTN